MSLDVNMNILNRAIKYVIGIPKDTTPNWTERETTQSQFGPCLVDAEGNASDQWLYGANRMTDMACKVSDDLAWWYDDNSEQFVVRNSDYDMERRENELWRAMWVLERDIRVEHGSKLPQADERKDPYASAFAGEA